MNRIFFKGSPYPNGHKIKNFIWSGRLKKGKGLLFDFHLETEDYYAEDESQTEEGDDDVSDWESKIVWENYHRCTISSTYWNGNGILVGTKEEQIDFSKLAGKELVVDTIEKGTDYVMDDLAFNIYLLGHDSCANHRIAFVKQHEKFVFDLVWRGAIALTYAGEREFKYSFRAEMNQISFAGIALDENLSAHENAALLKASVVDATVFEIVENKFQLR